MLDKIYNKLKQVKQSTSGATVIYFALILPVFVGFAGLGFDATLWFMQKRQLQSVADSAAVTAAYALSKNETDQSIFIAAKNDAGTNNFHVGVDEPNTILVSTPPIIGDFVGETTHVMVTLTRPGGRMFTKILGLPETTIQAIATAAITTSGEHCILALDKTRDRALEFSGTSDVDINCGVASNSNSPESIYLNGSASLAASPSAQSYGGVYEGVNATLDTDYPIQALSQRSEDPFADLVVPGFTGCDFTNRSVKSNEGAVTLDEGVYCDGILFNAGADVTFNPGVYIINGGAFEARGGSILKGTGVTIILTGPTVPTIATVTINGNAEVNLTAPTSGYWAGILFFQDPDAVYEDGVNSFLGGATMNLKGALYFPTQELRFNGGASGVSGCLLLVANKVTFSGNSTLNNDHSDCGSMGLDGAIGRILITLEE